MAARLPDSIIPDAVQIFDAGAALTTDPGASGHATMAVSPNCTIEVLRAAPRGQVEVPVERDADVIVLVLGGEANVEGPSGTRTVHRDQGVLIPAGVRCAFTSMSDEELALLSFRSDSAESRPGYVPNMPSGVKIRVPQAEVAAKGIGKHLYVFAVDHRTIRVAVNATQEWNQGAFLRMNCEYEHVGDDLLVNLPERMARWYGVKVLSEADYRIVPQPDATSALVDLTPFVEREVAAALISPAPS